MTVYLLDVFYTVKSYIWESIKIYVNYVLTFVSKCKEKSDNNPSHSQIMNLYGEAWKLWMGSRSSVDPYLVLLYIQIKIPWGKISLNTWCIPIVVLCCTPCLPFQHVRGRSPCAIPVKIKPTVKNTIIYQINLKDLPVANKVVAYTIISMHYMHLKCKC